MAVVRTATPTGQPLLIAFWQTARNGDDYGTVSELAKSCVVPRVAAS